MKKYSFKNIYRNLKGFYIFGFKKRVYLRGKIFLDKRLKIEIDKGLRIYSFLKKVSFFGHGKIIIGENVFINGGVIFECRSSVKIGNNTKIGYDVLIIDAENHSVDGVTLPINKPIDIGENVWIGAKSVILPGIKIGNNAVIAAGSIVNRDVISNSLVGGVPIKILKKEIYKNGCNARI